MKGFIATALCGAGLLTGTFGCTWWGIESYSDLVDPCYPARYDYAARQEVISAVAPQMSNGHVLDQTIWNSHFEPGTDKITSGGLAKLTQARKELDQKRADAVQNYLATYAGPRGLAFQVLVHDPSEVGISAVP